ncbi:hypothetical protein CG723_08780 [Streptomyces sp. CB01635]|nr:hypothetical protein CG723_08780 [Streptomyces sp. CB01635]
MRAARPGGQSAWSSPIRLKPSALSIVALTVSGRTAGERPHRLQGRREGLGGHVGLGGPGVLAVDGWVPFAAAHRATPLTIVQIRRHLSNRAVDEVTRQEVRPRTRRCRSAREKRPVSTAQPVNVG